MSDTTRPPASSPVSTPPSSAGSMPYPEIVLGEGERYRLFDTLRMPWLPTNGMTDKQGRRLFAPFHAAFRHVSRHELAHVKWSPEQMPELDFDVRIYLAVEDARINLGLDCIGAGVALSDADREMVIGLARSDLARGDAAAVVLRAIAGIGTNADGDVLAALEGAEPSGLVERLTARVRARLRAGMARRQAPVASPGLAIRAAREVADVLAQHGLALRGDPAGVVIGCVFGRCSHDEDGLLAAGGLPGSDPTRERGVEIEPGELEIVEAPLPVRAAGPRGRGARVWRPATEGCVLRYPHRIALDGAVYRRAVRRHGATIVVDASGSMRLRVGDLEAILAAAPGHSTVALYAGDGSRGELRVVARGGRRAAAADLAPPGVGNVVDVPSLEWLARQPAPRCWVTDGGVTGIDDQPSLALRRRSEEICRRARIARVRRPADAVAWLRGGAPAPDVRGR